MGEGPDFVWAVESGRPPVLAHRFRRRARATSRGRPVGLPGKATHRDRPQRGVVRRRQVHRRRQQYPGLSPESYPQPGVPEGKLTGPIEMESKVYPGMKANLWYYVPAQWDGVTPLAVQIWGDGQMYTRRMTSYRVLETLDNLHQSKRIPLTVNVFVQPGTVEGSSIRSKEYDTVDDTYARYMLDEILPEVAKKCKIRQDGYSRPSSANSPAASARLTPPGSGRTSSARVLSWIGSFSAMQVSETASGRRGSLSDHGPAGGETEHPHLAAGRRGGPGEPAAELAAAEPPPGEFAQDEGLRFHLSFGLGTHNRCRARRIWPSRWPGCGAITTRRRPARSSSKTRRRKKSRCGG